MTVMPLAAGTMASDSSYPPSTRVLPRNTSIDREPKHATVEVGVLCEHLVVIFSVIRSSNVLCPRREGQ